MILAPLAGITNLPFRLLAKQSGCGLVYSEMISANGLVHGSQKTYAMLKSLRVEKPFSVQIFGSDLQKMAAAAQIAEGAGADILDINFGCSVKKVLKTGAGVALMREPEQVEKLLQAVRKAVRIPLTIKIRSGWDPSGIQALQIAEIAETCGVNALALHPRTAGQGFRGKADWSLIAALKKKISIPVIGNGDVCDADDAERMIKETGCDAVMVGRAAIGSPWILAQIIARLKGEDWVPPSLAERFAYMQKYIRANSVYLGEEHASRMLRSRLGWFSKGLPHSSRFRDMIKNISSEQEALELTETYRTLLAPSG